MPVYTIYEAKQYLVNRTTELARRYLPPGVEFEVAFKRMPQASARAETTYDRDTGHLSVKIIFDNTFVRLNANNIRNPAIESHFIMHELGHAADDVKMLRADPKIKEEYYRKYHYNRTPATQHRSPGYREFIRENVGDSTAALSGIPQELIDYTAFYGSNKPAIVPDDIRDQYLGVCQECGRVGIYSKIRKRACDFCKSSNIKLVKKLSPGEVSRTLTSAFARGGDTDAPEAQAYIRKKYSRYIGRHRARVKKQPSILDRAMRMIGGRYG